MKAVVMAGGEGSRLRPLTCNRPKPLVPVCNKPVMEYIVELLKRHGIDQIVVTLHYLANEVVSYFGDGSDWGVQMTYSVEDEPLGTAGSVKKVEHLLNDTFLIISGDALTDFDLTKAIEYQKAKESMATITLTRVDNPLEFGVVITDDDGKVRRFLEKPSWGEVFSDTINTGIYILEPEIFNYMEPEKAYDFSKDLFPKMLQEGEPLYGYVTGGYWCDIGNLQQYRQAHYDLFAGRCDAQIPGEKIGKDVWIGEGTEIHPGAQIAGPIALGRHVRIKEGAYVGDETTIGDNCIVEEGATINRSVVWNNVYLGKKTRTTGATICRQSTIKANATISDGVILGDKCFVGQGAVIHPQVKVWPDKNIEAGATVSMSLIWGIKWPGSLFAVNGISGLANIEITPEFALKLGAAYGAYLEKGATICTSRDPHPAARMLNRAIICGLLSVGVNVYDLRAMPTPVSRFAIRNQGSKGGVHTRLDPDDPRLLLVEFFDPRGINIDKSAERKIENFFFREDFRRTSMDDVGVIDFPARVIDGYMEGFYMAVNTDAVRKAGFKIVIDYSFGNSALVLPLLLGKLGTETVALNAYLDALKGRSAIEERDKGLAQLANIVTTLGADLGIRVSQDAETIVLIDEKGNIIDGHQLLALMTSLGLRSVKNGIAAVPVTAPSVIDRIAHECQGKVIRTKTDGRSLMHTAQLGEKKILFAGTGGASSSIFHPVFDGMFAFAKLLEMMAQQKTKLSDVMASIPPFYMADTTIDCAWQRKGRVMRRMIEESRDKPVEMIDGVKAYFDGGWVLVNPDPSEPCLHLYVEGQSEAHALEVLADYTQKVEQMVNDGPDEPVAATLSAHGEKSRARRRRRTESPTVEDQIAQDGGVVPYERSFHFWAPGRYLGVRAESFREFVNTLHYIDAESLEYHFERGDFSNWIEYELSNAALADKIRKIHEHNVRGEQLRSKLLKVVR